MLDSTTVRAHQHRAGKNEQAITRSKNGLHTKIHPYTDVLGNPTGFFHVAGQAHDLNTADRLLNLLSPTWCMDEACNSRALVIDPIIRSIVSFHLKIMRLIHLIMLDIFIKQDIWSIFLPSSNSIESIATPYDKLAQNLQQQFIWLKQSPPKYLRSVPTACTAVQRSEKFEVNIKVGWHFFYIYKVRVLFRQNFCCFIAAKNMLVPLCWDQSNTLLLLM